MGTLIVQSVNWSITFWGAAGSCEAIKNDSFALNSVMKYFFLAGNISLHFVSLQMHLRGTSK